MIKRFTYGILFVVVFGYQSFAQELKLFTVSDFELNGNVKTCTVITNYGKEVFEFNENGFLIKSITAYNDVDQDITTYQYDKGFLKEKRTESYKNTILDTSSSLASFYKIDTTKQKIIREQIISYDKEFVEEQEYVFGEEDKVFKIITSHENAVDETSIEYTFLKDEVTKTTFLNGVIQKSVRTSNKRSVATGNKKVVLTKEYLDGEPNKALEQRFNVNGKLVYEELFLHDTKQSAFTSKESHVFEYNAEGVLEKETIKKGNAIDLKEFSFQFDANKDKNWVRKITIPENTFITRKITYFPAEEEVIVTPE